MQYSKRTLLHFSSRTSWLTLLAGECVKCKMQYPAKNLNYELHTGPHASCLDFFFFASCLDFFFFCKLPEWAMCPLGFYITTNWVRRRCGLESGETFQLLFSTISETLVLVFLRSCRLLFEKLQKYIDCLKIQITPSIL